MSPDSSDSEIGKSNRTGIDTSLAASYRELFAARHGKEEGCGGAGAQARAEADQPARAGAEYQAEKLTGNRAVQGKLPTGESVGS